MAILTTRRALIVLCSFTGIVLAAYYYALLGGRTNTYDVQVQNQRLVRYESGRLVARSQVDVYKIVEQWVQPEGQSNLSSVRKRKERLIEDRHVIRESIEYGESENEHSKMLNNSVLNGQTNDIVGKRGKLKKSPVVTYGNHKALDLLGTNKSAQNGSMVTNGNRWQQQVMEQETNHKLVADEKNSLQLNGRETADDGSFNSSRVSANATMLRSSELGNTSVVSKFKKASTEKLQSENVRMQPSVEAQAKRRPSFESTRTRLQGVVSNNSTHTKPRAQQYKKSDIESKFQAKHQLTLESTQTDSHIARPNVVSTKNSTEPRARSSSKVNLADIPVKWTSLAERGSLIPSKNSLTNVDRRESRMAHAQPPVKLDSEIENVVHIQTKQQSAAESRAALVMKNNKYYKSRSNPIAKVKGRGENPPKMVHVMSASSYRHSRVQGSEQKVNMSKARNPTVPLLYIGKKDNKELENTDVELDPRYVDLPEAVKKKLDKINKDRAQRMKFLRLINKRCEGHKYCLYNVRPDERYLHNKCFYEAIQLESEGTELNVCQCKMLEMPSKLFRGRRIYNNVTLPRVALVSLPGSGNTWVRGLLEQATGYCTGSMWCDPMLRAKQFCAEGVRSNTLVIKNHDPKIRWVSQRLPVNASHKGITNLNKPTFNSAIFVHRNPYEATIAEWNRALGSMVNNATKHNQTVSGIGSYNISDLKNQHTVTFGEEAFGTHPGWNKTIYTQMENWEAMINHLLINNTMNRPVLLVKYEDLKRDAYQEVERMVTFLDVTFLTADVKIVMQDGLHAFHRNRTYTFDHYTREQKLYVNSVIRRVAKQLQLHNIDYFRVEKYLRHT